MQLKITNRAAEWLSQRAALTAGQAVALLPVKQANGQVVIRYQVKTPDQSVASVDWQGIRYYVEFADEWYFSGKKVTIDYRDGQLIALFDGYNQDKAGADASTAASRNYEDYWE